jgi:peptidyl-prolyl cis-trans isomerase C
MKIRTIFLPICCALLAYSQAASTGSTATKPAQPPASTSTAPPSSSSSPTASVELKTRGPEATVAKDPSKIVATIAGKSITAKQAYDLLQQVPAQYRTQASSNLSLLLQQVYMQQVFAADAQQLNLDKQSPYKEQLEFSRNQVLTQAYLQHLRTTSSAPTQDPQQYYTAHSGDFDQAKINGIVVVFSPPGTPAQAGRPSRTEADARAKADDLEKKLKGGADFATLAKTESDSATSSNEMTVTAGDQRMPADIKATIFKTPAGQITEPIRTNNAFYIFKVTSRTQQSFEQAKPEITQKLQNERDQALLKEEFQKYQIQVQDTDFFNTSPAASANKVPSLANPSSSTAKPATSTGTSTAAQH